MNEVCDLHVDLLESIKPVLEQLVLGALSIHLCLLAFESRLQQHLILRQPTLYL